MQYKKKQMKSFACDVYVGLIKDRPTETNLKGDYQKLAVGYNSI